MLRRFSGHDVIGKIEVCLDYQPQQDGATLHVTKNVCSLFINVGWDLGHFGYFSAIIDILISKIIFKMFGASVDILLRQALQ